MYGPRWLTLLARSVACVLAAVHVVANAQGGSVGFRDDGVQLRISLTSEPGLIEVTWRVPDETLAAGADVFTLQLYTGRGRPWQDQFFTEEPNHGRAPALIRGVPEAFCFRMTATVGGRGRALGSGLAGTQAPCPERASPAPVPPAPTPPSPPPPTPPPTRPTAPDGAAAVLVPLLQILLEWRI